MAVDGVGSSTNTPKTPDTGTTQSPSNGAASLNYDAFLKLLTAQMKFQDPTKPMDSTQFVAQLASFSNVEQSIKTNNKLDSLLVQQALNQVDGLIGKTVTSADGSVTGKVKGVEIYSNGAVAVLENDKKVFMTAGVKITNPAPAGTT
ncbi:flagellar hook assembly protein FlgD [Hyphomicrobium sp.]|uniref:flagellar hook assembly protein FlgD n=1 Tax=Hyphomicrobium sp. TaxID=82 RepID=UPI002E325F12|nr:flagellar hook assembly protein FlgD [Hyphomicrobium sp.]HEX2841758.1 flagellar hook assembly protein FlgD [Hyphomicrobium sp.]